MDVEPVAFVWSFPIPKAAVALTPPDAAPLCAIAVDPRLRLSAKTPVLDAVDPLIEASKSTLLDVLIGVIETLKFVIGVSEPVGMD